MQQSDKELIQALRTLAKAMDDMPGCYGRNTAERLRAWAAEHPAPRYPTWREWQNSMFPNRGRNIRPCEFDDNSRFDCEAKGCIQCMDEPIPADIAAKLGIRPMEEG